MISWCASFAAWLFVGLALFHTVTKAARKSHSLPPSPRVMFAWILLSAGAAEVTRYYLIIIPVPPLLWSMAAIGIAGIGAVAGLASGWFIAGPSFGGAADMLAGILGGMVAAWAEITSSYNYVDCAIAVIVASSVFATLALRLYARSKLPQYPETI